MRIPDPKANTTTEAYLAYKAGYLEESELKPVLYEPYLHFDAWLAYWAGLTNEYPLDKNGDPEMLTDEEALVAYLSGVTDTYPEEIKDPYDVRIVGYLKHLVSIRWPEPDYPVNNEEFYLSNMEPTHTSNPVPSSDIELDTAEGKIISVEAYGDTYQQTYSGKNLLPFTNQDFTFKGIHCYVSNGSLYFDGTSSGEGYTGNEVWKNNFSFTLQSGTYTVSNQSGFASACRIRRFSDDENLIQDVTSTASSKTFTLAEETKVYLGFYIHSVVYSNTKIVVQLETGSTATAFEPYVGGIPAPNPDYPQPIQVVTGEQNVWVHGKNLLDPTNLTYVYANSPSQIVLSTISDGIRMVNTGGVSQGRFVVFKSVDLTGYVGKTIKMKATFGVGGGIRLYRIKSDGTGRNSMASTTVSDTEISFNVPQDLGESNYLGYALDNTIGSGNAVDFTNLIMTIDDDIDPYEPYQSQSYEIDLTGKNLLDVTTFENGYINSSGTVSGGGGKNAVFGFMPVLPETDYTLSVQNNSFAMAIAYYDSEKTLISRITNDYVGRTSRTFTTPQNCAYARAGFYAGSGAGQSVMEESLPQFEKGSQPTTYAPYAPYYNYELCKIGDYQDYIYKSGDDWYVHKETAMVDVSSLDGWFASGSYAYKTRNGMSDILPVSSDSATAVGLCNAFSASTTNLVYAGSVDYGFALPGAGGVGILIRNKNVASLADFTTYLSNNPVYGYFALATPTNTKITDATLVGQLEALAGADTYNEKTYIKVTATDPNLPALLKVEAYKY